MYLFLGFLILERIFSVSPKIELSIFNDTVFMAYIIFYKGIYNMYILKVYLSNIYQMCFGIQHNVRRYVQLPTASRWHEFLPSCWVWRFFRFIKSSRNAKTMTPSGSAPAFSRGQPVGFWEAALAVRTG